VAWDPSSKISDAHRARLAVVYIRQSTPQQLIRHQESTVLQYQLQRKARDLGWPSDRIRLIDTDLGRSASGTQQRPGFQELVAEVGLGHVGLVLGLDISRLARSCKEWYHLLEICALFDTLISDQDGLYNPADYNDRLLLGLKGTMSEAELHTLRQRMEQGRLNKARRGELFNFVPTGYIRDPDGTVAIDPDEQVQGVIRLIFEQFERIGTINGVLRYLVDHGIRLGVRPHAGPLRGRLEWRRPNRVTLSNLLHNPIYAGTYVWGRTKVDPCRKRPDSARSGRVVIPPEEWDIVLHDRLPAYITWEQFQSNQQRLAQNRPLWGQPGAPRNGTTLLGGVVICGRCGAHMMASVSSGGYPRYSCLREAIDYGGPYCQSLRSDGLDAWVTQQILQALQPASLALSLQAAEDLEHQRALLYTQWRQRLERVDYDVQRAFRQYDAVDPDNRLVARQLEAQWEATLHKQADLQEAFSRFEATQPRRLTPAERVQIQRLSEDLPALWQADTTTAADRKSIVRLLIEGVVVRVVGQTEHVHVTILWHGGAQTHGDIVRPVARLDQLSYYPALCDRLRALMDQGLSLRQITARLNAEGFRPPKRAEHYTVGAISSLRSRLGLVRTCRKTPPSALERRADEWLLSELATHLDMPTVTLHHWIRRGVVQARQPDGGQGRWLIWADVEEVNRLRQRRQQHRRSLRSPQPMDQEAQILPGASPRQERTASLT
jgi:DNA invertase Pin-like site-specific DNA recombinase/DNA-binding transcriptional MerR regulator